MIAKATAKYIRTSDRKLREVINLIKGRQVESAQAILDGLNKRAAYFVKKTLNSAISNARKKGVTDVSSVFISNITADGGPSFKRYRAAPFGRATMIRRRTAHLAIELDSKSTEAKGDRGKPIKTRLKKLRWDKR